MGSADTVAALRVSVAYSPGAGVVDEVALVVAPGSTVAQALVSSGLQARHPTLDLAAASIGVWGGLCAADRVLRDGDRVEVYRALRVDPKEARRERYRDDRNRPGTTKAAGRKSKR